MTVDQARLLAQEARTLALTMDFILRGVPTRLASDAPVRPTRRQEWRRFVPPEGDK